MSILGYLESLAGDALFLPGEKCKVTEATDRLRGRLDDYFGEEVVEHFAFGSALRGTSLPKVYSEKTDVDYMVVFKEDGCTPRTYLNRLLAFAEDRYRQSTVYQASPAVVIEMAPVTFELVAAVPAFFTTHKIPDSRAQRWIGTNPRGFEAEIVHRNKQCDNKLKAAIRLAKMWNVENDYVFSSFELERKAVGFIYPGDKNLRQYFYRIMFNLPDGELNSKARREKLQRARELLDQAAALEREGDAAGANALLDDLFGVI